jgi:hypothetical protein
MLFDIGKIIFITFFINYVCCSEEEKEAINNYVSIYVSRVLEKSFFCLDYFIHYIYFEGETTNNKIEDNKEHIKEDKKIEIKYEDKYLEDIRKMDKEYRFTEEENEKKTFKANTIYNDVILEYTSKIKGIEEKIIKIETKLARYEGSSDDEYCEVDENGDDDTLLGDTKEDKINNLLNEKNKLMYNYQKTKQFIETNQGQNDIMENAKKKADEFVMNERLDTLKNNFVIEKTPHGNVLMFWNNNRSSFQYYSDNTIPYRYLEPVGRKYVKTFDCRSIFVDMEEEIKLSEERIQKEKEEKERKEIEEKTRIEENQQSSIQQKKNVFAKFKSYNKEAGSGRVNMVAPPKNSIPNKPVTEPDKTELVILKDRANRYTYEGKFSNFNFLKKIERKVVDKKYAMSFADFKKNILMKK